MTTYGPIGRLGGWTATHFKAVVIAWGVLAVGLGFFAPKVEKALSGAGWESTGSESVAARKTIDENFQGLSSSALMVVVHSSDRTVSDPAFQKAVASTQRVLKSDSRVKSVRAAAARDVDLARRPHRDRAGRRGVGRQHHGARGRRPEDQAASSPGRRRAGFADRRVAACGLTSTPPTARR